MDAINGIGPENAKLLLRELKSVKKIKEADLPILAAIIGIGKANLVYNHFRAQKDKKD